MCDHRPKLDSLSRFFVLGMFVRGGGILLQTIIIVPLRILRTEA